RGHRWQPRRGERRAVDLAQVEALHAGGRCLIARHVAEEVASQAVREEQRALAVDDENAFVDEVDDRGELRRVLGGFALELTRAGDVVEHRYGAGESGVGAAPSVRAADAFANISRPSASVTSTGSTSASRTAPRIVVGSTDVMRDSASRRIACASTRPSPAWRARRASSAHRGRT